MENSIIATKSYQFALKVIKTYKVLKNSEKEFILSKQFLRSGTSIGANIEEAEGAPSKKTLPINFLFHLRRRARLGIG